MTRVTIGVVATDWV